MALMSLKVLILKHRWFRILVFLLMGQSSMVMEDFRHFCFMKTEL